MNKSIKNRVRLEALTKCFETTPTTQVGAFVGGLIFIYGLYGVIPTQQLTIWFTALLFTIIYRLYSWHSFRSAKNKGPVNLSYWENIFVFGVLFVAICWGFSSFYLFPTQSFEHQVFIQFILIIVTGVSITVFYPMLKALYLVIFIILLPLIFIQLYHLTTMSILFAFGIIVYMVFLIKSGKRLNHSLINGLFKQYGAENKVAESQTQVDKYQLFYERSEDSMLILKDGKFVMANPAAVSLFECQSQKQLLESNPLVFAPELQPNKTNTFNMLEKIESLVIQNGNHRFELIYRTIKGNKHPADITLTLIPYEGGRAIFCLVRDISTSKKIEQDLITANKLSKEANIAKSEFLANMSHEIRTPMNGVLGLTNILMQHPLNSDQLLRAKSIKSSAQTMLSILNNILDFSKIEEGMLILEKRNFNLCQLIQEFSSSVLNDIRAKNLTLNTTAITDRNCWYIGDSVRIKQILINLMDNAIKFTEKGSISLDYKVEKELEKNTLIKFTIIDTGLGIEEKQFEKLFTRFTQVDSTTTRKFGGSGLGLSICKQLVLAMDGEIGFNSEIGVGSSFWFTIKLGNAGITKSNTDKPPLNKGQLIQFSEKALIVDDNIINIDVAKGMLELFGLTIDCVSNGAEAITALEEHHYGLVFMDCQMPILNGYDASKMIRNKNSKVLNHDIPIIAMTANALIGDREICLESGMDDYIAKPLDLELLQEKLLLWLPESTRHIY